MQKTCQDNYTDTDIIIIIKEIYRAQDRPKATSAPTLLKLTQQTCVNMTVR